MPWFGRIVGMAINETINENGGINMSQQEEQPWASGGKLHNVKPKSKNKFSCICQRNLTKINIRIQQIQTVIMESPHNY